MIQRRSPLPKHGQRGGRLVLRPPRGAIICIHVKEDAAARLEKFRGMLPQVEVVNDRFACGILVHHGLRIGRTAPKVSAMPFGMLWNA